MKINNYELSEKNYFKIENDKSQIVLASTFNRDMRHFIGWKHRYNGEYTKTTPFTINRDGVVFTHFDPKYQSRFFDNSELDNKCIVILMDNEGGLRYGLNKSEFYTWNGDIYNSNELIINQKWRGYDYWVPYTEEQMLSAGKLIKKLCKEFSIPKRVLSHNTKIDDLGNYEGVVYKSNIVKNSTDLSPSWDFKRFKGIIEKKIKK